MVIFSKKELDYLKGQQLGRIACVSKDQSPHVTPVAFASAENKIYLNIEYNSKKAKNIRRNPKVKFLVDDLLSFEDFRGVLVNGEAELISSGSHHEIARDLIYKKYPKYEEQYPIQEEGWSKYILVISLTKISSWGPLEKIS